MTSYVLLALWWLIPAAVVVIAGMGIWRHARAGRSQRLGLSCMLACTGLWLLPVTQYHLDHPRQEQFLARVLGFTGRPLSELQAELGPPDQSETGVMTYDPSPWYAPLGLESVRLVEFEEGVLGTAYIDD